jgi:hypothetical protein
MIRDRYRVIGGKKMNFLTGGALTGNPQTDTLMMEWAGNHPYLFTLIEVSQSALPIILSVFAVNVLVKLYTYNRANRRR